MALGLGNPSARSQQAIVVYKSGRLSMSSLSVRVHMFFFGETRLGLNCSFFFVGDRAGDIANLVAQKI